MIETVPEEDHRRICALTLSTLDQALGLLLYHRGGYQLTQPFLDRLEYFINVLKRSLVTDTAPRASESVSIDQSSPSLPDFDGKEIFKGSEKFRKEYIISDDVSDKVLSMKINDASEKIKKYLKKPKSEFPLNQIEIFKEIILKLKKRIPR
ncbi:hypothetical protein KAU08_07250 [bacterium]|nr:hypothetical protein [bacterium]